MKIARYDIWILSALLVVCSLSGCTRRDLSDYPDGVPLRIVLEWGYNTRPAATGYHFYDGEGNPPFYREGTADGFEGNIPPGTYRVVIYNTDPVNASHRHVGNYDEDHFVAHQIQQRSTDGKIESVSNVYGAGITEVAVPRFSETPIVRSATPARLTRRVSYTLDVGGIGGIASLELYQGGAITDKCIVSNKPLTGNTASLYGKATFDDDKNLYLSELSAFGFFGPCPLTATATFVDGSTATTVPIDLNEDLVEHGEEDITLNLVLKLADQGDINVQVKIHGWKVGGSGGSIIQ